MTAPRLLPVRRIEKVWGRESLPEPFATPGTGRIGEIWFEPPPEQPELLVKYLFTSEALSVQVHPCDETALPGEHGKEECWLVLDAQPGARLAIGFREELTREAVGNAARDGSIEQLLAWHEVEAGDFVYLPAGTVHAIGPGLSLVEVQQNSDTTFRLYDYGRDRELHLERALAVASTGVFDPAAIRRLGGESGLLVDGPRFRLYRAVGAPGPEIGALFASPALVLVLAGDAQASGLALEPGNCALIERVADMVCEADAVVLVAAPC